MPLNTKGKKIKSAMEHEYGEKKGKQVFYASENKGTIKDVIAKRMAGRKHGVGMGKSHYSGKHYSH